ncbi:hypothetical protein DXG01_005355, partial [Tephrocybe rancida]
MSEEYWKSLQDMPAPKEGMWIKLYQLTGNAKVLGYMKTSIFMETMDHQMAAFELEAYIVRDMNILLLLGKDFQTMYKRALYTPPPSP